MTWLKLLNLDFFFSGRFSGMKECTNTYYIIVIENVETKKLVAAASLILEQKFIHEIAMVRTLHKFSYAAFLINISKRAFFDTSLIIFIFTTLIM